MNKLSSLAKAGKRVINFDGGGDRDHNSFDYIRGIPCNSASSTPLSYSKDYERVEEETTTTYIPKRFLWNTGNMKFFLFLTFYSKFRLKSFFIITTLKILWRLVPLDYQNLRRMREKKI
jgi:hypothetical protein